MGALEGERGLPSKLVATLHDGPFGLSHLRALAADLARVRTGGREVRARYLWPVAFVRNVLFFPVVLVHAFRVPLSNLRAMVVPTR
jgi:hypothetical protein